MKIVFATRFIRVFDVKCVIAAGLVAFGLAGSTGLSEAGENAQRTVLITGANRGLGLEFARQYAADGWQVIGTARRPDSADDLNALGVKVLQLDVADAASVEALAATLDSTIDPASIDTARIVASEAIRSICSSTMPASSQG